MLQLNPALPLNTPKGEGFAHFLIDYGPESDLYWTVFITETGEIWTFANKDVRASKNITLGRSAPSQPPRSAGRGTGSVDGRGSAVVPLSGKDGG